MNYTFIDRFKKTALTYFFSSLIIGVCFAAVYGLRLIKDQLEEGKLSSGKVNENTVRALSILSSLFVVGVNKILLIIIRKFSLREKPITWTAYNMSVALKLTIGRFVNSALIPVIINSKFEKWFNEGGLVVDVTYLIVAISIIEPLSVYFDVFYMIRKLRRWKEKRLGEDSKMNQSEANELFKGNKLDMANRLSNTANLLLVCIFYAPMMPLAPIVGCFGMFLSYWIEKYLLLRRH